MTITRDQLWTLEDYAIERPNFRQKVMAHKKLRQLALDDHLRLYFEDRTTIHYQIQEMLRIEKVFDPEGIQEELDAYNPLIPDGHNWKATMMLEYADESERKKRLSELRGVEHKVWMKVEGFDAIYPVCDEDLERDDGDKTASVHFVRYDLSPDMIRALKQGAQIYAGVHHDAYDKIEVLVSNDIHKSLCDDLVETAFH